MLRRRELIAKDFTPAPRFRPLRWTAKLAARLGRKSDVQLAQELGIDQRSVWAKRPLGIPAWSPRRL